MSEFTMTIDGTAAVSSGWFDVINPATTKVVARVPSCTREQLDEAMASAQRAYQRWRLDDQARREALRLAASRVEAATDRLSALLTAEQGKPLRDSRNEIASCCRWLRYYADLDLPHEVVQNDTSGRVEVVRRPLGVVAAITPWNFPLLLAIWKVAPALRAGNSLVVKPSPYTPLTTLLLGEVLRDVLPPGVLNVITGPDPLGAELTKHPMPRKISFTGSIETGKRVAAAAAADLKRLTLELGGNDPAIVLDDVDVGAIADRLFWGAFQNNGQVCLAIKRLYVHERVHDDLVDAIVERARSVRVDDGAVEGTQLGPVNNRPQLDRVADLVSEALGTGAVAAAGGRAIDRPGYFYAPTILTNVTDGVRIVDQEQFGPALPIIAFRDLDDAIDRANRGHYGLTASVWTTDPERGYAVADQLDCGQVSLNVHGGAVRPELPFGGHRWSGLGVENGPWGLYGFTELQAIVGPPRRARHPQWTST